jgi:putative hydrolase of the HAD superfamily
LTNGRLDQQHAKLVASGLRSAVEVLLTSDELGVAKPAAAAFAAACDAFGLPRSEVAYVGDRLDVDAEAACDAGLRGIWLNRRDVVATTAVETICSLHELPALI